MRLKPKMAVIEYLVKKAAEHPEFAWSAVGSGPLFDWLYQSPLVNPRNLTVKALTDIEIRISRYLVEISHCYGY